MLRFGSEQPFGEDVVVDVVFARCAGYGDLAAFDDVAIDINPQPDSSK